MGAPVDPTYKPYAYWTQQNYISSPCVASNCTMPCTLGQASGALNCQDTLQARPLGADAIGSSSVLTKTLTDALKDPGTMVLINFDRCAHHTFFH